MRLTILLVFLLFSHLSLAAGISLDQLNKTLLKINLTLYASELKQLSIQLAKHKGNDSLNECYNPKIGRNGSVNIFEDDLLKVVRMFFIGNDYLEMTSEAETKERVHIFVRNIVHVGKQILECVRKWNGKKATRLGLTPMAYYSPDEFQKHFINNKIEKKSPPHLPRGFYSLSHKRDNNCSLIRRPNEQIPRTWNWAEKGVLSAVKTQGKCSDCYVIASNDILEAAYHIRTGKPIALSAQATLECMDEGCNGGSIQQPLAHLVRFGAPTEAELPYKPNAQGPCQRYRPAVKASRYCYHLYASDEDMKLMVWRNGPVAVAINVAGAIQNFHETLWEDRCENALNHVVVLVGWTEKNWILKNSWGPNWGAAGYFQIPMGVNKCGINNIMGLPLVKG